MCACLQVLYKFADSADVATPEDLESQPVDSCPQAPDEEVVVKTYGLKEMCTQAAKSFADPLFLMLVGFVGFIGVVWIPNAITTNDKLNTFRQIGDLMHFLAFFVLLLRLYRNKSAAGDHGGISYCLSHSVLLGISHKTQELMLAVFISRYTDLFTVFISWYLLSEESRIFVNQTAASVSLAGTTL